MEKESLKHIRVFLTFIAQKTEKQSEWNDMELSGLNRDSSLGFSSLCSICLL